MLIQHNHYLEMAETGTCNIPDELFSIKIYLFLLTFFMSTIWTQMFSKVSFFAAVKMQNQSYQVKQKIR